MIPTRPVLRWHGGKWMLAPWILAHFPSHRIYTEVFGGAASVLMQKDRCYAEVYNDLDNEVVNLFRVLREKETAEALREQLRLTPFARAEFDLSYEPHTEPIERARRLVVRSYMGFGSNACNSMRKTGFRSASHRSGTTPAGDWKNYTNAMLAIIERLRGVVIENRAAIEVLEAHDSDDTLHYVDPPYVHATRKAGNLENYTHEMTDGDHRDLARALHKLGGGVVLSGYPCPLYDEELFSGWHRVERDALADGAQKRTEVLWINERAWTAAGRLF